jgi:uncharacterized membrane protein YecN with MAPEG domain
MSLTITSFYAGLLALMLVVLSIRVIKLRISTRTSLGDGGDEALNRRMRIHGNFIEFVPMGLILLALSEIQGAPSWALHVLGLLLLGGRVCHAIGMEGGGKRLSFRRIGMIATFSMLILAGLGLVGHSLF